MAGQSPRAIRQASTGTNERVTSPTHGSLISRRSVSVARIMNATMLMVKGAGSWTTAATRDSGRRGADQAYVERDGRAFPHGRLVMTDQFRRLGVHCPSMRIVHRNFAHWYSVQRNLVHRNLAHATSVQRNLVHRNFSHATPVQRNLVHRNFVHRNFVHRNLVHPYFVHTARSQAA